MSDPVALVSQGQNQAQPSDPRRAADSGERAYFAILDLLTEFALKPEERINEVQLARKLGLSRTPVREALNRLASEGWVLFTPNRGFSVRSLSTDGLLDLYELRLIIETAAFTLMCERADDSGIQRLVDFWEAIEPDYFNHPPATILAEDEAFHLLIAELSGNPELLHQLSVINARIRFLRRIQIEHLTHEDAQINAHTAIVEAAKNRDIERGVVLLHEHIDMTVAHTQQAIKDALLKAYLPSGDGIKVRRRIASGS